MIATQAKAFIDRRLVQPNSLDVGEGHRLPHRSQRSNRSWLGDPLTVRTNQGSRERSLNRQKELIGRTVRDGAPLVLFDQSDPSEWTAGHFSKILPATADAEVLEATAE
jgi:hypothetical protein